jgi:hypothetical protein
MGLIILALLASFIPSLIFFFWFRSANKDQDYRKECTSTLFNGLYSVIPVCCMSALFALFKNLVLKDHVPVLVLEAFRTFVIAAVAEELVKFWLGKKHIKARGLLCSKIEVIAFMTIIACGFNITESCTYAIGSNVITVLVRGVCALHEFYGLMMGFWYAKYIETGETKYKVFAILIPILLHGLYDFSLSKDLLALSDNMAFLPFGVILVTWIIGIRFLIKTVKGKKDGSFRFPLLNIESILG